MLWAYMNQPSTVPEYILEQSEKMHLMENLPAYIHRDMSQVVVDLVELSKAASLLEDLSVSIGNRLQELARSVQEQH